MAQPKREQPNHWPDWALFGMRVLIVAFVAVLVYLQRTTPPIVTPFEWTPFLIVGGALVVTNLILAGMILLKVDGTAVAAISGDWVLLAFLTYLSMGDPFIITMIIISFVLSGFLRLGLLIGGLQALGALMIPPVTLAALQVSFNPQQNLLNVAAVIGFTLAAALWTYFRDENIQGIENRITNVMKQVDQDMNSIREQTTAIAEMSEALSSTTNYERILDEVLNVGQLCVRKIGKTRLISMVMLFRSDESLEIISSRGLSSIDESRVIPGKQGLIAETMDLSAPIISKGVKDDPELGTIGSLYGMRSTLCVPLRANYTNYGALLFASEEVNAFNENNIGTIKAIGAQASIALRNADLHRSLLNEKERIIEMEENARKALVRDLHDIPTQTVSAIAMRLRIIQKLVERGSDEVMSELKIVEDMSLRATEELRHVLFKLRPLALESQGLSAALNQLADKMQKTYKQNMAVKVGSDVEKYMDQNAQGVVFYLIEEAVNNARKYAEAKLISVQVGRRGEVLMVIISDNGKGFDAEAVNAGYDNRGSFGMVNMRERAELLDGTLKLESAIGRGTRITVTIPISEKLLNSGKSIAEIQDKKPTRPVPDGKSQKTRVR